MKIKPRNAMLASLFLILAAGVAPPTWQAPFNRSLATPLFNQWLESEIFKSVRYCGAPASGDVCAEWINLDGSVASCCIPETALGTSDPDQWIICMEGVPRDDID